MTNPIDSQVVHSSRVAVRCAPAPDAKPVGIKMPGDMLVGVEEVSGWVKLAGNTASEQWMRIDGRELGLGRLLERMDIDDAFRKHREEDED